MKHLSTGKPLLLLLLPLIFVFEGCHQQTAKWVAPPPEVSVTTVVAERVEISTELPGRISPVRESQVRARATGIILKRDFEEGSLVKEGQLLFEIDPIPLQAQLDSARAALAKASAAILDSKARVARYEELIQIHAVSQQLFDEAKSTLAQNEADLLATTAAVRISELNLGYARVTAPITGRISKALVTEGALVSATDATPLAMIRQLDPVYFDFTQSSAEVLRLHQAVEKGALQSVGMHETPLALTLEDGTAYPHTGRLLFSDIVVDPTTGTITLRAEVTNPENVLLPGMFVRAKLIEAVQTNATVIPQRTVQRGAGGATSVLVVNPDDRVEARTIEIERIVGNRVVVAKGLRVGEKIIVEGSQKAPPGSTVKTVPFRPASPTTGN